MQSEPEKKLMNSLATEHKQVLSLLREGLENATCSKDISMLTGLSNERIRAIINELVVKHGVIIGGSNKKNAAGYFIPVTLEEEEAALKNLTSRRLAITERENALSRNILKRKRGFDGGSDQVAG